MLYTKFQGSQILGSGEDFHMVFTIYGLSGHLGQQTKTHLNKLSFPQPQEAKIDMKCSYDLPKGFCREVIWNVNSCDFKIKIKGHLLSFMLIQGF